MGCACAHVCATRYEYRDQRTNFWELVLYTMSSDDQTWVVRLYQLSHLTILNQIIFKIAKNGKYQELINVPSLSENRHVCLRHVAPQSQTWPILGKETMAHPCDGSPWLSTGQDLETASRSTSIVSMIVFPEIFNWRGNTHHDHEGQGLGQGPWAKWKEEKEK